MPSQIVGVEKVDIPGCAVDEKSFAKIVEQAWQPDHEANPGDPVVTFGGIGTLNSTVILNRWHEQEAYEYAYRTLCSQDPGIGWGYLQIPSIAGFQPPIITVEGTYRSASTSVQRDNQGGDGGDGASPRGPFMGQEAHHWSSTQRIYLGYYRRDNAYSIYIDYRMRYICL